MLVHNNLEALEGLTEDQLEELSGGREQIAVVARELLKSGELVSTIALTEPAETKDVQLVAGTPVVSDRPLLETKEFLAGALVVHCESIERALELAALVPLAKYRRIVIREIKFDHEEFLAQLDQL
jgi:hypothetical protein